MKTFVKSFFQRISVAKFILLTVALISLKGVYAQEKQSITGKLIENKSNQAVPYATIALIKESDSKIINGTMSDENGVFNFTPVSSGNYRLQVSNIGYKPLTRSIEVVNTGVTDAGIMVLQDTAILLDELIITGERIKAKSESDRTTFFVTKKMLDVSGTGVDVLRLIPGVQIDLMQNISLEGSRDILIFVDGRERDKNFVSQLIPSQIDRIEVISVPPSNYDGNVTGAINIILKKDRDSGINGQILAEIPLSAAEIFISPTYSLSYGFKKLNMYTSYNGEMTYLNIHESISRKTWIDSETNEITSDQYVRQKYWSHRFHYGFDYFLSPHDQFNFYAFYNPFSRELDGYADSQISGTINSNWHAKKDDKDINNSTFYSLYYKHSFNKKGSEITADISNYNLKAENITTYTCNGSENGMLTQTNAVKPGQKAISIKVDYQTILHDKLIFSTGVKAKLQKSHDRLSDFEYNENIFAVYGNVSYKAEKLAISLGLRAEQSVAELKGKFRNPVPALLPYANFNYKLTSGQNLQLSYNRSVKRPNVYELNPYTSVNDPYSVSMGNPFLRPEYTGSIFLEHTLQFDGNFIASRFFCNRTTDAMNGLTFINDTSAFETQVKNLGTINQFGFQFSGSLKFSILTLNPYVKLYGLYTSGNNLAKYYSITNNNSLGFGSGLSAIASFKHDLAFSVTFQFNSPRNEIQGNSFSGLLYFLSLEKTFKQKIKAGIVSAIPFTKSFTYQGSEIDGSNFHSYYKGNVKISGIPVWFRLSYQFSSGKSRNKIDRSKEEIENRPKKGF